jgi:hypothetical protein
MLSNPCLVPFLENDCLSLFLQRRNLSVRGPIPLVGRANVLVSIVLIGGTNSATLRLTLEMNHACSYDDFMDILVGD